MSMFLLYIYYIKDTRGRCNLVLALIAHTETVFFKTKTKSVVTFVDFPSMPSFQSMSCAASQHFEKMPIWL